jgi:uncharacterized membrane protein YGL010W
MTPGDLIAWQWNDYGRAHRSRANLVLHLVAVPAFLVSNVALVASLATARWALAGACLPAMLLAFAVQAIGHGRERERPAPFSSPWNALSRIFVEQWVNFPRFVVSGGWASAMRATPGEQTEPPRPRDMA